MNKIYLLDDSILSVGFILFDARDWTQSLEMLDKLSLGCILSMKEFHRDYLRHKNLKCYFNLYSKARGVPSCKSYCQF